MVVDYIEYVFVSQESKHEISILLKELKSDGIETPELNNWSGLGLAAILLCTKNGSDYIVEPQAKDYSLVTRINERPPISADGEHIPDLLDVIVRRQAEPDSSLVVGERVVFNGLNIGGQSYDISSRLTTTPLVEIKYIGTDY